MEKDSNYDVFMNINIEKYKGKWIAVCESHVVSSGENAKKTYEEAQKKCPNKKILIAKVPEEQTMIY